MRQTQEKIKKFNENNWFEWGGLRNEITINKLKNKLCIYVRNLTRKSEIAFIGTVNYFGGGLLALIPKNENMKIEELIIFALSALVLAIATSNQLLENVDYFEKYKWGLIILISSIFVLIMFKKKELFEILK